MQRPYIPFLVFLIFLLLTIPLSFDFASSAIPGWHTTSYPPFFIGEFIVSIVLLLVATGYWRLSKKTGKINRTIYIVHMVLTIPTILYLRFPILFEVQSTDVVQAIKALEFQMALISVALLLCIAGQIMFLIYYIRAIKAKRVVK